MGETRIMSYRAGFIGIIGQPNAGKSTLLNLLVKEKLSIVTAKPQTTRRRVLGIVTKPEGQAVFVDAPGIVRAKSGLNAFLEKEAVDVIAQSDSLLAVLSLGEKTKENILEILGLVKTAKKPVLFVITKSDLMASRHRLVIIKDLIQENSPNATIIELSTKWGSDQTEIATEIINQSIKLLPEVDKPLYEEDLYTPHRTRDLVSEIVREKCFETLDKEVPYSLTVRIAKYDETNPKLIKIYADIISTKESHKGIIVGQGARTIKKIGMQSRPEIEKLVGSKVFLKLEVVVRENWSENKLLMKDLGYVVSE